MSARLRVIGPGKSLNFKRRKRVAVDTPDERAEKDRLVAEFLERHGARKCPDASAFSLGYEQVGG